MHRAVSIIVMPAVSTENIHAYPHIGKHVLELLLGSNRKFTFTRDHIHIGVRSRSLQQVGPIGKRRPIKKRGEQLSSQWLPRSI
ncbi:hypothetical protein D3C81_2228650 [compost metagenome]